MINVLGEPIQTVLEVRRRQPTGPREVHERPLRLKHEQDAREKLGARKLLSQPLPAALAEQDAQIGGRVDVVPLRRHRDQPERPRGRRSSSRTSK